MITTRDIIHDTHATHVTETPGSQPGSLLQLQRAEFQALHSALAQLGSALHAGRTCGVHYGGREYTVLAAHSNVTIRNSGGLRAELTLVRAGDPATRWIVVTYSLYHTPRAPVCAFVGNPTTLIAGSNVRPVRVDHTDLMSETVTFFRIGFEFLAALCAPFAWSTPTAARLRAGDIAVSNTQWALYLPTADKTRDMALLAGLYCGRLAHETTSQCLGEYLGFHAADVVHGRGGALTGLFLTRKWGTNHVLSVNFYDKRQAVANKHQTPTLSAADRGLLDASIRLDITAHTGWLTTMIRAAQRHVDVLCAVKPALRDRLHVFFAGTTPTAARVSRAMQLLSYTVVNGALVRTGFAAWLLHAVLEDELHLIGLLQGTVDHLDAVHTDPACTRLLDVWRRGVRWDDMARACGCSTATLYRSRERLRTDTGIDVRIPYAYWRDWAFVSLTYGLDATATDAVRRAIYNTGADPATRAAALDTAAATRAHALEASRRRMLQSISTVARAVEATPLVALLAGDDSLWTDPRVCWTPEPVHVAG